MTENVVTWEEFQALKAKVKELEEKLSAGKDSRIDLTTSAVRHFKPKDKE